MSGWIINIAGDRPRNWDIAKDNLLWATKSHHRIRAGDDLFFWKTKGGGLIAHAVAIEDARPVTDDEGVPWPDHTEQHYVSRFGMTEIAEADEPLTTSWKQLQDWGGFRALANRSVLEIDNGSAIDRLRALFTESTAAAIAPTIRSLVEAERAQIDSTEDARIFAQRSVAARQGQPQFKQRLIEAYGGRCCITSCDARPALEAAHIAPYRGEHTNELWNGLLLRADIHTLFDLFELTIDAVSQTVTLSDDLRASQYAELVGRKLAEPVEQSAAPARRVLTLHNQGFRRRHPGSPA